MTGGNAARYERQDDDRIDALSYLVEALIIGQWARTRDPLSRARSDIARAQTRLEASGVGLSSGAQNEVNRILTNALDRLQDEMTKPDLSS